MNLKQNWLTYLFYTLYVLVSVATFRHTSYGFATIESGSFWWGALSALAIDAGMILAASALRKVRNGWLVLGLCVSAVASVYTQLLYAVSEASPIVVAEGAQWLGKYAEFIANIRVLLLPALLPLLAVVYAFSAKAETPTKDDELQRKVDSILAQGMGKHDTARQVWQLSSNGYGEFTVPQVAELVGCSIRTAEKAREE